MPLHSKINVRKSCINMLKEIYKFLLHKLNNITEMIIIIYTSPKTEEKAMKVCIPSTLLYKESRGTEYLRQNPSAA